MQNTNCYQKLMCSRNISVSSLPFIDKFFISLSRISRYIMFMTSHNLKVKNMIASRSWKALLLFFVNHTEMVAVEIGSVQYLAAFITSSLPNDVSSKLISEGTITKTKALFYAFKFRKHFNQSSAFRSVSRTPANI